MNLKELIVVCRDRIDDRIEPYIVSDDQLTIYANRAQREACERSYCLYDKFTYPIVAETTELLLDPVVLAVVTARFEGELLQQVPAHGFENFKELSEPAFPRFFIQTNKTFYFYPPPKDDGVLDIYVYRYPNYPMLEYTDEPEIPENQHLYLSHWMAWEAGRLLWLKASASSSDPRLVQTELAFSGRDAQLAERELALFERRFGRARSSLELQSWIELPRDTHVKYRDF